MVDISFPWDSLDSGITKWVSSKSISYRNATGDLHNPNGPAIISTNGEYITWAFNGNILSFDEYIKLAKWSDDQLVEWKLTHEV